MFAVAVCSNRRVCIFVCRCPRYWFAVVVIEVCVVCSRRYARKQYVVVDACKWLAEDV